MREKIKVLLDIVRKLEETSKEAAGKSKSAANELSAGLVSSYSMAGDVEHAKNSANLSIQKHASIKKLANELEDAVVLDIPTMVQSGCYIKIEMSGIKKELYLVNNPVYISGHSLVSPASPIGEALLGKKPGDLFLYNSIQENPMRQHGDELNADMSSSNTKGYLGRKAAGGRHKSGDQTFTGKILEIG